MAESLEDQLRWLFVPHCLASMEAEAVSIPGTGWDFQKTSTGQAGLGTGLCFCPALD